MQPALGQGGAQPQGQSELVRLNNLHTQHRRVTHTTRQVAPMLRQAASKKRLCDALTGTHWWPYMGHGLALGWLAGPTTLHYQLLPSRFTACCAYKGTTHIAAPTQIPCGGVVCR